jgi:hypothetical protein
MEALRDKISFERKETHKDGSTRVYFKFSDLRSLPADSVCDNEDLQLAAIRYNDGIVLVHSGTAIISFPSDGKVLVLNPFPVLNTMRSIVAQRVNKIEQQTRKTRSRFESLKGLNSEEESQISEMLVPFLFLCGAKLNTAKMLTIMQEAHDQDKYDTLLLPNDKAIQTSWLSNTRVNKLASYLLKKLDPERKGLKALLESLFEE